MLFACDLDRTLIYSAMFLKELPHGQSQAYCPVEIKDGQEISYITLTGKEMLKQLAKKVLFVPATTRTWAQYCRIKFLQDEIIPKYAIVNNGGTILVEGAPDRNWQQLLARRLKQECLPVEEVMRKFGELNLNRWVQTQRQVENLFFYQIIEQDLLVQEELLSFIKWLKGQQWQVTAQGRKLYFIPKCINKGEAVAYVRAHANESLIAAAGDSQLDWGMLEQANFAFVPRHGEIVKLIVGGATGQNPFHVTAASGLRAGEEILGEIIALNVTQEAGDRIQKSE